jgi:crotonobetaine/carnitine-CoA ligase
MAEEKARRAGDEILFLFEDQRVTNAEFNEAANRAANGLLQLGIKKGDKVCLCLPNCPEWLYLWFGMAKIGAVLVPLMPGLPGPFLSHMVNDSDAETVITHSSLLDAFQTREGVLDNVKNIILDGHGSRDGAARLPAGAIPLEHVFEAPADPPRIDVGHPDVSLMVYTSGTTGFPKAVVKRHPAPRREPEPRPNRPKGLKAGEVMYTCHAVHTWFEGLPSCLMTGIVGAFSKEPRIETFWEDVRRYDAAGFSYFAELIPALLSQPEKPDDADNPARICTGIMAPRDPEVIAAFEKRFGVIVIESYGSSEGGGVTANRTRKPGSVGKPIEEVEVKIIDDEGNELGPGEVGEIVHRRLVGEPITVEYYKKPEESAAKTRSGWYHSDDLGYLDEDGYLYFVDRKLDVVKKGGKEIFVSEIEMAASKHPHVSECAAVGVLYGPDGDDVKLSVICKDGTTITPEEMLAFCQERLEDHMVPRYIEFRDSFPRSSRGKVQKCKLQDEGVTAGTWDRERTALKG